MEQILESAQISTAQAQASPQNSSHEEKSFIVGGIPIGTIQTKKALIFSLWDGIFANAMIALTETFSVAAAVYLKAPALAIAMLGSLPLLLGSIGQLFLPKFADPLRGRKFYVVRGIACQGILLLLLALSGWLPDKVNSWAYVAIFSLAGFSGNVIAGLWIAWMGQLVPPQVRGRHFAWRNRIFSITQLACALLAGFISRNYTTETATWLVFAAMFFAAGAFRLLSANMISHQYEPIVPKLTIAELQTKDSRKSLNFVKYSIAAGLMQGVVAIAGPFFNVWYIRDLKFDYFTLSIATASTVVGVIVTLPLWGKLADTIGNKRIIKIAALLISTVPLPYIFADQAWQIWILNFYCGVCWSGYNLGNFNYLLCAAGKHEPEKKISYAVAITGISVFLFSLLGGFLSTRLPTYFTWQLQTLFILSAILRFVVYGALFSYLPDCEEKREFTAEELFHSVPGYRVGMGAFRNVFRAFRNK